MSQTIKHIRIFIRMNWENMFLLGFFFEFFDYIRIFQNGKENKQLLESIDRDKGHSIITFALRGEVGFIKMWTYANVRM